MQRYFGVAVPVAAHATGVADALAADAYCCSVVRHTSCAVADCVLEGAAADAVPACDVPCECFGRHPMGDFL